MRLWRLVQRLIFGAEKPNEEVLLREARHVVIDENQGALLFDRQLSEAEMQVIRDAWTRRYLGPRNGA